MQFIRTLTLLGMGAFSLTPLQAQYFKVDTIRFESADVDYFAEGNNIFPDLVLDKHWKAAGFINDYLHMDFLHVMPHTKGNPFEMISPSEGDMQGASSIDFRVQNNSSRIFSVGISFDYTSAYTENFSLYYNFNSQTGEYITLADLFGNESLERIQQQLAALRVVEIQEFLSSVDTQQELGREQYELYTSCINYIRESSVLYESFYLTDTTITFIHERCSNHAMMAIDDLGEYYTTLSLRTLKNELSIFGKELLYGKPAKAKSNPVYPGMKLMKGKIGKDLQVSFIMGRMYPGSQDVSGVYFYNKYGNRIELSATISDTQWEINEYSGPNVKNAHMSGTYTKGVFTGTWIHHTDGRKLPVVIKLAHQ